MGKLAAFEIETLGVFLKMPAAKAGHERDISFALIAVSGVLEHETSSRDELLEVFIQAPARFNASLPEFLKQRFQRRPESIKNFLLFRGCNHLYLVAPCARLFG